jgi:hypothetical protein
MVNDVFIDISVLSVMLDNGNSIHGRSTMPFTIGEKALELGSEVAPLRNRARELQPGQILIVGGMLYVIYEVNGDHSFLARQLKAKKTWKKGEYQVEGWNGSDLAHMDTTMVASVLGFLSNFTSELHVQDGMPKAA